MKPVTSYPAKLLLFGEYSVLLGSRALGIPIKAFHAGLDFINQLNGVSLIRAEESNIQLKKLCDYYLEKLLVFAKFLDLDRFVADVKEGLYLSSTIPRQYGMGSSGALCAALFGRYGIIKKEQLTILREKFIQMESCFHGKSSGFDPLVIYLQKAIMLEVGGEAIPFTSNNINGDYKIKVYLIDSGIFRSNTPFVNNFLDAFAPGGIVGTSAQKLISLTNSCIDKFISENEDDFWKEILNLSRFQLDTMSHLIPNHLQRYWSEGLQSELFALKLCGSGGGGYFTCFTLNKKGSVNYFRNRTIGIVEI